MIYVPKYKNEFSEDAKMLVEENGEVFKADMPKQEMPEFKEEVSEDAKMLVVEEDGKVYRAGMPSGGIGIAIIIVLEDNTTTCNVDYETLYNAYTNHEYIPIIVYKSHDWYKNCYLPEQVSVESDHLMIHIPNGYRINYNADGTISHYDVG